MNKILTVDEVINNARINAAWCHARALENKDADLFKKAAEYYYIYGDTKNGNICLETSKALRYMRSESS